MGMDFNMIVGHSILINEIKNLIEDKNLWVDLKAYFKSELNYEPVNPYVKWNKEPTVENLNQFWDASGADQDDFYLEIDCYFGNITIFRNTIRIWFSTIFYSYKFFQDPIYTRKIIQVGRIFAQHLNKEKVLYIPDGYVQTAIIEDYVSEGNTMDEIIKKGISKFGAPPKGISKGRKNYFFVDYVNQEIGKIKEWDSEEDFWIWNDIKRGYEQIKK